MNTGYDVGAAIVGALVFIGCWVYCIATYGFLLGVGLGWLPSLITAYICAILWPVLVVVLLGIVLFVFAR